MANFSLYISGQTELGDVTEFFQKRLIGEGETPIAFFDGVFYESHQERVGNIVYQDYLIFSDKALYLWARGASKDFLDRFTLGAVSVNSRNKDSAFATMNLKIRREGKEPVFVIFDMVEIAEAEMIVRLQIAVESTIEDYLGVNYRHEIPPDTADRILQAARNVCPPQMVSLPLESPQAPQMPTPDAGIGYGQDLLEQYRAMGGHPGQPSPGQGAPYGEQPRRGGMGIPGIGAPPFAPPGGLEAMLPTDPASLKRIADQIKNMVGNAPFKLRDQVMKDLQHVPGDVATVLTALNELLANIAGNPMAERFVMNAIKTAVVNDGMIGSLGKIIKMTGFGSGSGKKSAPPSGTAPEERSASRPRKSPFEEEQADGSSTIRRKKISIKDDEENPAAGLFAGSDEPISSREERKPAAARSAAPDENAGGGRRKKLSIKMEDDNEIARKLMSYDESEREAPEPPVAEPVGSASATPPAQPAANGTGARRKKLSIKAEEGSGAKADIAQKLMTYDEERRGAINTLSKAEEPEVEVDAEAVVAPEPERPVRKKIQIVASEEPHAEAVSEPESEPEKPVRKKIQIVATEETEEASAPEVEPEVESQADPEPEEEIPVIELTAIEAVLVESEFEVSPESVELSAAESDLAFEHQVEIAPEPEMPVKRKVQIVSSDEPKVESVSEPQLAAEPEEASPVIEAVASDVASEAKPEPETATAPEPEVPVKKRVQIVATEQPEAASALEVQPEADSQLEAGLEDEVPVIELTAIEAALEAEAEADAKPESVESPAPESAPEPEPEALVRKKVQIVATEEPEAASAPEPESSPEKSEEIVISEEALFVALGQEPEPEERPAASNEYMTIESDDPAKKISNINPAEQPRRPSGKSGRAKRRGKKA